MTEDEAKTKWCFRRKPDPIYFPEPSNIRCIGSACMAWRWEPLMADEAFKVAVQKAAAEMGDTSTGRHKAAQHVMANRAEYGLPTKPFDGFCGLANKP
jgi:hypothetical protein